MYVWILPLGRPKCMRRYCLLVGLDVCFLILPLGRLKCMFASSTLAFISQLHHCCYSCIVSFTLHHIFMGLPIKFNID